MAKINSLLSSRLKKAKSKFSKMTDLAELSSTGSLSSFSGVFKVAPLAEMEKEALRALLDNYKEDGQKIEKDFTNLAVIASEVKAINNQAVILHGERVKRAQQLLKNYREGAFSAWLMVTYGNRQTPYNFLQYFELHSTLSSTLKPRLDEMPKQVVYTLASRTGEREKKEDFIRNYKGESKRELIREIRKTFPVHNHDGRQANLAHQAVSTLDRLHLMLKDGKFRPTDRQKREIARRMNEINTLIQ